MAAGGAQAQDAQLYPVAAASLSPAAQESVSSVQILEDADHAANMWVVDNPSRLAVSVAIGRDTLVAADKVEEVLRRDFAQHGVTNIKFFYEMGGSGDSTVFYHIDGNAWGPYSLARARDFVSESASQFKINSQMAMLR
nr:hypothetical protein GCM10011355_34230 [Aquisalinus luteolus]